MGNLPLSIRQRSLLYCLHHVSGYVTGDKLSKHLGVSPRTIRNEVAEINVLLQGSGVRITSKHSFGYIIEAQNADEFKGLTQAGESCISKAERLRHIAFRLCLSDKPIDLDDLADEMYISKTTLERDLKDFRQTFALPELPILVTRSKNSIEFLQDERKRRAILCRLYSEDWNYNGRGNTFFQYQYLQEKVVNICICEINFYLDNHSIRMEDTNIVHLDLAIAIAYNRIKEGHELTNERENLYFSREAVSAVDELLDSLEGKLNCSFSKCERMEIYELVSCSILPDMQKVEAEGIENYFNPELVHFTDKYLAQLKSEFGLDFFQNHDFYITLLLYLRYLTLPVHHLNNTDIIRSQVLLDYAIEFEIALCIQPLALDFYGNYLDFRELLYLSTLISGALTSALHPKLKTVVLSHFNLLVSWNLKIQIEDHFPSYIHITDLLPVNQKDNFDFSDTDLILSTTDKQIFSKKDTVTLKISPFFTEDDKKKIEHFIRQVRFKSLYRKDFPDICTILEKASWHESVEETDYLQLLKRMGMNLIEAGFADHTYLEDIFRREKLLTFVNHPSFLVVHSAVPAKQTHIEIFTLNHRLRINGQKIRMVIMICMAQEDRNLIFKFFSELYNGNFDPNESRFLKTKSEYLKFFKEHLTD